MQSVSRNRICGQIGLPLEPAAIPAGLRAVERELFIAMEKCRNDTHAMTSFCLFSTNAIIIPCGRTGNALLHDHRVLTGREIEFRMRDYKSSKAAAYPFSHTPCT
jgi:hypothetical protein